MALQMTIVKVKADGQNCRVAFNLTPVAGTQYVTGVGGDTVNFTTATQDALFLGVAPFIPSDQAPVNLDIWDVSGNIANTFLPVLGASQSACKLKILSAYGTELASGAYPATMKLVGEAEFYKNV